MKESEENEIVIENTNTNKNNSNEKNEGVLDKIRILKSENYKIEKKNIALIKSSPDNEIEELIKKLTGTENSINNIGIRKTLKIISGEISIKEIYLYDYNYYIFNIYSYLKKEVMKNCDIYAIICNIFDQNLETYFNEFVDYLKKNMEYSKKKLVFILIKSTNNFLMSMVSSEQLISVKEKISTLFKGFKYFCIHIDINEINVDSLLDDIIKI
jgi:hypothetical protein